MPLTFAEETASALPLHVVEPGALEGWAGAQGGTVKTWVKATGFSGGIGEVLLVPDANGAPFLAVAGYGTAAQRARGRFALAAVAEKLPDGVYRLDGDLSAVALEEEALGWLLTGYAFDRYRAQKASGARLVAPEGVDARRVEIIAAGEALTRDLINTPASDMGPQELEDVARGLATVTHAPAQSVGLTDRGTIKVGARGDVIRFARLDGLPILRETWVEGQRVF